MVEVFKTDVNDLALADKLTHEIRQAFAGYEVNFDLEDCDKILRVEYRSGLIDSGNLVTLLKELGCTAEILPDEICSDEAGLLAG